MPPAERARDRGRRIGRVIIEDLAGELREARIAAGLSQAAVARAAGLTQPQISELERACRARVGVYELAAHAAALGLRLSAKVYPEGPPVRDAGQLRLLQRFREALPGRLPWRTEVLIGGFGDLRAWDAMIPGPVTVGIDAETRLRDIQATQRRCETKWRDSGIDRVILVVAATHHNRRVLREHRAALASTFPADTAEVMQSLRRGRAPERNGIVVI